MKPQQTALRNAIYHFAKKSIPTLKCTFINKLIYDQGGKTQTEFISIRGLATIGLYHCLHLTRHRQIQESERHYVAVIKYIEMHFHGNQLLWAIKHPFISLCFKPHSSSFICFSAILAPVISGLDEIYCTVLLLLAISKWIELQLPD